MNCIEAKDVLPLHVAGELEDEGAFLTHLAVCEACARRTELHQRVWDLAGLAPEEPLPESAVRGVAAGIRRQRRAFPFLKLASIAAAAVLAWLALSPRPEPSLPQLCAPPDEPRSAYVEPAFGELTVEEAQASGPLGLRSHRVSVEIGDWGMRTEIEEIFTNGSDRRLEGTFQFPLPADASLSRFAMEVNGVLVEGELVERVRAREVYEGIVRRMQDPALLEWMPGNIFKARVFPIEPRSEKRILLAYTQAPRMWNGAIRYVYPLVSEKTKACPPEALSVKVDLRFAREIKKLQCPTHRADISRPDARSARVALALRNARPVEDFQVRVEIEPDELEVASHRASGEDGFIGIAFAPRTAAATAKAGTTVFVLDRSARMTEKELSIAARLVDRMLDHAGEEARAGFVAHHIESQILRPERVTPERRREWRDFLSALRGEGASDVEGAIRAAAAMTPAGGTVIYVGKGVPTWGESDLAKAAPALDGRTFRAVLVGSGANEALGALGPVQSIQRGGEVEAEIGAIARTVAVRPIEDLRVSLEGAELREPAPTQMPAIYPGERVHFFARYVPGERPAKATVVVRGRANGLTYEKRREVELASAPTEHRALPRLWAQSALAPRIAECQRRGEPRDLVDGIVAMSRQYQVMTPYTSFLVLESEEAYQQYKIERARRREEEARKEEEQKKRLAEAAAKPASENQVTVQTSNEEMEKIIRDLARGRTQEERERIARSQKFYQTALSWNNRGEFEKALIEARKAVEAWHENIAARKLINDLQQLTVGGKAEFGARTTAEDAAGTFRVQIEQANIEITKHIRDGERYYNARMYDEARREFDNAQFKIESIPYEVRGMKELLPRVKSSIMMTRKAGAVEERRVAMERGTVAESETTRSMRGGEGEQTLKNLRPTRGAQGAAKISSADDHYELAERYFQEGDFEKAALESQKAIELNGNHAPARALKMEVEFNLGRGRVTTASKESDDYLREALVRHQQTLVEIDNAMAAGQRLYNAGDTAKAEREFRRILEYAKWMPTGVELETRRTQALEMLDRTRLTGPGFSSQESARVTQRTNDQKRDLEILFGQAQMYFERGQYARSAEAADKLLAIDPNLTAVQEMKNVAQRLDHMKEGRDNVKEYLEEWKRSFERTELNAAVQADLLRFPDREAWKELIAKRKPKGIAGLEEDLKDEDRTILDKLKSIRITIDMQNAPLSAVVDYFREVSGLNIHLSGVDNADSEMMSVKVSDVAVDGALQRVLGPRDLAYVVRDGVVVITKADQIKKQVRLELYDVQDLTYGMNDFPGVDVTLAQDSIGPAEPSTSGRGQIIKPRVAGFEEDPDIIAIHRKLETMKIDLAFENTKLDDVLSYLRDFSGLNLVVDAGIMIDPRKAVTLKAKGLLLKEALTRLLGLLGLDYRITEEKVVLIVRGTYTGEELAALVKESMGPGAWSEAEGKTIQFQNGLLVVRNTPEMHAMVRAFLRRLRGEGSSRAETEGRMAEIRRKIKEESRITNHESPEGSSRR